MPASSDHGPVVPHLPLWKAIVFPALAGALGWGIRGQYGHETGAMIAGLLVSLVLALLFCPQANSLAVARAVAWCTVAIGFGGSMTYGQTVGLTHDAPLVGNWAALRWGLLGLAIKGGLWIGFGAAFLGMGLGGVRYRAEEMFLVMVALLGLAFAGVWLLNSPFDPAAKVLPKIYFSDSWFWEPGTELKPRKEVWGGMLLALSGLIAYTGWRRDGLAWRLGLCGVLAGAIGFPAGQSLQAFHAWNLESFRSGPWAHLDPLINWWNFMETTFGAVFGAILGAGLWFNRSRIAPLAKPPQPIESGLSLWMESTLLLAHVFLLVTSEFVVIDAISAAYDFGLILGLIPVVAIAGGRYAPYFVILPITLLPIAAKTLRRLAYQQTQETQLAPVAGWTLYLIVPLLLMTALSIYFVRSAQTGTKHNTANENATGTATVNATRQFLAISLLASIWVYFTLNFAFFQFPWPWGTWTQRTPNAIAFTICAVGLTLFALSERRNPPVVLK